MANAVRSRSKTWMQRLMFCIVGSAAISLCAAEATPEAPVTLLSLLEEMADVERLARFPHPSYRSLQASSYNRKSVRRGEPGWFADQDGVSFIRKETINGRPEWVLMEHDGPGCITRVWTPFFYYGMKNRGGPNVKIYLDGSSEPVIDENLIKLVTAKGFVKPPFAHETARAGDLYLPIPFARSCKVTTNMKPFYNIINYRAYPAGTAVETFTMSGYKAAAGRLEAVGKALLTPPSYTGGTSQVAEPTIAPGASARIQLPQGPAAVRSLDIQLDVDAVKADPSILRSLVLTMTCDGEETIWCPVGDFFCSANAINPIQTWTRAMTRDGQMTCRWVMPYQKKATVSLSNLSKQDVRVSMKLRTGPWTWDDRSMTFRANWRSDDVVAGDKFQDWNFIDIQGKGVFVGDAWTVLSPGRGWWGEGDEKIYVDDAYEKGFPTHFGTGTEDYYGWAGGEVPKRRDVFSKPYLANASVGSTAENNPRGFNVCTRIRALDAIPFHKRLVFDMEASSGVGSRNLWDLLGYSSVSFWYARPGAKSNRPPVPEAAAKPIVSLKDLDERSAALGKPPRKRRKR